MISAREELDRFLDRRAKTFEQALLNLLAAKFQGRGEPKEALQDLARLMRSTLILSDLHGRRRTLLERDHMARAAQFAQLPDRNPIVYGVTFEEAVEDLLLREPRLARSAAQVQAMYSAERVFAMALSVSKKLTERVQSAIADILSSGKGLPQAEGAIMKMAAEESHDFARAYAATVYRTNVNSSYTEGRFQQTKDPEVAAVIKAFEYVGVDDQGTRRGRPEDYGANHKAAFGLIASTEDPVWHRCKPPNGYQCRCGVIFVSKFELERRGLLRPDGTVARYEPPGFAHFRPDPGFKGGQF